MELSEEAIHDVIHPTAAFCNACTRSTAHEGPTTTGVGQEGDWDASFLNPKNRIDSLEIPRNPLWQMDGCTAFGSQFYATPLFVDGPMPPLRMDVFVPEPSKLSSHVREMLDVDVTFHTRDKHRIAQVGLTRHVLRILHHWASQWDDPRRIYENKPFGSKIVLRNMPISVTKADIVIAPAHYLEHQLLSLSSLEEFWAADVDEFPPAVDVGEFAYVSQLHDSVCLVELAGEVLIFKALTSYSKYLYHELRQLLLMRPHPNIISRPVHLVTKRCGFGSKVAVLGFTEEFHTGGSIRDLIPFLELHNRLAPATKARWASQLSSALVHLRHEVGTFYSDLRLDNIVLSASGDVVMVDFEQRGVWCEFAAPEVNAIEYVRLLAVDDDVSPDVRARYAAILSEMLPGWEAMRDGEEYRWPAPGYNIPWACLTPTEQEACEVYMLGRVLWCIFESESAPQRAAMWLSYRWEPAVEFPVFTRTPRLVRDLIDRCTRGRTQGLSRLIVRERDRLVLRELEGTGLSTAEQVQETARDWWSAELDTSEAWLRSRIDGLRRGSWNENYYRRPTLRQVYAELKAYEECISSSG
ncbi:Protein kinase domain [Geosmithia morbida]|uniref:Protein kinase domain n=1 Tax=Geosmithia morbida TaxID=1094350 RepID=A0A9P4YYE1_9HYPO|nr:Protein kinase domain [Geosmithia morbida]KAF4123958.1 Protein kinase domain [Geosmithia morbida]